MFALSGCRKDPVPAPAPVPNPPSPQTKNVQSVSLNMASCTVEEGQMLNLEALIVPDDADNRNVEWAVSDTEILEIFEIKGLKARFECVSSGRATVTVKTEDGGLIARCQVTVAAYNPGPNPDPNPDPDPDPDPTPVTGSHYGNYFELPVMTDANKDGRCDTDQSLYYAQHHFTMNSRKYRNYTVCFSGEQHCPLWVAAPRHSVYEGSTGRTEAYKADPDIPSSLQYVRKSADSGCNNGHMLGSAERTCCTAANQQVFYYSNIAPQLSTGFNTGGGGWNILEDYVDGQVCSDTLYVVIGTYFKQYTDAYGNTVAPKKISFGDRSDVGFPTMFYYVLMRTKSGNSRKALKDCAVSEIKCAAFVRSHTNNLKGQKVSSREMMSVSDLEKITGITYFPNVPNAPKSTFSASEWGL